MLVRVRRRHAFDQLRCGTKIPLTDVEQDEHWLLGQEAEPADGLRLVIVETEVADRRAGLEPRMDPLDHDLFPLGSLALGLRPVTTARPESLQPTLGHRQVGERELEVELLEIPHRVDRARRVGVGRVLERTDDVEERVGLAQPREMIGRQLLRPDPPLGGRRRRGEVDVRDVGLDDLLRLEDLGEPVEPVVGDLDDADVQRHATVPARLRVAARQRVENGGLAAAGKPDDRDLHGQYPAAGSTTLSSGSPVANRRRLSQKRSTLRSSTRPLDQAVCGVTITFGSS